MDNQLTIVGIGEVLWDIFPEGKQLGGAPANFAYITHMLGNRGIIVSRLGNDELGNETRERLDRLGIETAFLQTDLAHPTGTVHVQVDSAGQACYEITKGVAWDFLEWTPDWAELAQQAEAVCFGSLAQRSPQSRETIRKFVTSVRPGCVRVLDVNLRQSFFSRETLSDALQIADIVKLNHEELPRVLGMFGHAPANTGDAAEELRRVHKNKMVCITRGAKGSVLVTETERHEHPGFSVKVADTVGSGDAFTAGLVYHYLRGSSLNVMNDAANRLGAWLASQVGATPAPDAAMLQLLRAGASGD